jgi:hypothetical protein
MGIIMDYNGLYICSIGELMIIDGFVQKWWDAH